MPAAVELRNLSKRFGAFLAVVDAAIKEKVDFVILAGDLFEKRSIDALTLNQAMRGLERLRDANIPCIAVEGNHEHAYYGETLGWMRFLAVRDLMVLLDPEVCGTGFSETVLVTEHGCEVLTSGPRELIQLG